MIIHFCACAQTQFLNFDCKGSLFDSRQYIDLSFIQKKNKSTPKYQVWELLKFDSYSIAHGSMLLFYVKFNITSK